VDIRGEHHRGQEAIAAGHQAIFDSVYKGSSTDYELIQVRELSDDVILAHATGVLRAPSGPLAGEHSAVQSLVLVRDDDGWKIASFHKYARSATARAEDTVSVRPSRISQACQPPRHQPHHGRRGRT
jgi:uncharacterized protein (TIGR02246 family)